MGPGALRSGGNASVIQKPWGYEYCAFDNGEAAVWILHIARGKKTSRHCHPNKRTVLIPLQGDLHVNGRYRAPLEAVVIEKGVFHQTEVRAPEEPYSMNGAFVMEIEEPSNKADILREEDPYGRAGKPIELDEVPCNTETLKLCRKAQSLMGYTFKMESTLGGPVPDLMLPVGGEVLGIYKEPKKRVSDRVADFVRSHVQHVFGVCGGGSMHLNDSFRDIFIPMHHEQAAAMAAEAYARMNGFGVCLVTTGPGGTNAITGLACAWVDSIPVMFISGQVTRESMMVEGERQRGIQETNIVAMVKPITKYAVCVVDENKVMAELETAFKIAKEGQPGPVWIDIPLDVQSKLV